jgi:hypothetical protein
MAKEEDKIDGMFTEQNERQGVRNNKHQAMQKHAIERVKRGN